MEGDLARAAPDDAQPLAAREEGCALLLTLNRPPGNTLTVAVLRELRARVAEAASRAAPPALVLESAIDGYFSSGMDLDEMLALPPERRGDSFAALADAYRALLAYPAPCVAALSGSALLGGWVLAMAADWRLLADDAKISLSEIRAGIVPTPALISRLSRLSSSPALVKEMTLRGRSIAAPEALDAGLVDEVLPAAEVRPAARAQAARLIKSAPRAYARVKAALNAADADDALWARSLAEFGAVFSGEEAREGLSAFRDKRKPRWPAR